MWEPLEIERQLEAALVGAFNEAKGKQLFGEYTAARGMLPQVWEEIKRREANLTDHGPRHIADVLGQAHQLIPQNYFDARELLALMLSVLFHDAGNIHGREGHEKKISDIHAFVRGAPLPADKLEEKKIILAVVGAHGGVARDGGKDTIKDLDPTETFMRRSIRIREVAAVMRFADELAEGPQRTSEYLRRRHDFPIKSEKFHDYASITSICIDPQLERIALTYQISVFTDSGVIGNQELQRIQRLLEFAYHRIRKLDEERQYARYYSQALSTFKRTSATFNFWVDDEPRNLELSPIELNDLVVPGGHADAIPDIDNDYNIDSIIAKLKSADVQNVANDYRPVEQGNSANHAQKPGLIRQAMDWLRGTK